MSSDTTDKIPRLESENEFKTAILQPTLTVVHFSADWLDMSTNVNKYLFSFMSKNTYSNVKFYEIYIENFPNLGVQYEIKAAPTIIFFRNGKELEKVYGAVPNKINNALEKCINDNTNEETEKKNTLEDRLKSLINKSKVMLFMKGDRQNPRCGFSRQIIEILNNTGISYETFDILSDEEVRQGLKTYSDWPTYPQLYVKSELLGGLDIVKEMQENGDLIDTLKG